jgi:hypothetical protein
VGAESGAGACLIGVMETFMDGVARLVFGLPTRDAARSASSSFTAFLAALAARRATLKVFFASRYADLAAFAAFLARSAFF